MINVAQLRAARALVGLSQDKLAERSGVSKPTIARLELGSGELGGYAGTRDKLQRALEDAGVIFVEENGEGPGVRLRKQSATAHSLDRAINHEEANMAAFDAEDAEAKRASKSSTAPAGPATDVVQMMDAAIEEHETKRKR